MVSSQLTFDILARDQASAKLDKIGRSFDKLHGGAKKAEGGIGTLAGKLGGVLGSALKGGVIGVGLLGVGLAAATPKIVGAAANLELMGNKSARVFGDQLPKVQKWAAGAAHGMGLTNREAVGLAAGFQDLLVPMGFARDKAAEMSTKVIGLSGALSEWSGGQKTAAEVADTLSAAMLGERDGLQSLGISITQAEVDTRVLSNAKKGLKFATKEQAEAVATEQIIFEKSTDAQKAYATGAGTLARKMQISKARIKEMGETLLVKATPALKTIADMVSAHVIPVFEKFTNWFAGDGKFVVAEAALSWTRGILKFAEISTKILLGFADKAFAIFIKIEELMPGGPSKEKLEAQKRGFTQWRKSVESGIGGAIDQIDAWDEALNKMRTEAQIKANITDLQAKLKSAKTALNDKNLTRERRALLNASIDALERQLRTAKSKLADPALTKMRIAKLTADKTELEYRIRTAKQALDSPKLTATKRAKLTAYIGELQRQVNTAQSKINSLRGKTVTVNIVAKYSKILAGQRSDPTLGGLFPQRAAGGPVSAGMPYVVGEERPELFVPDRDGRILPGVTRIRFPKWHRQYGNWHPDLPSQVHSQYSTSSPMQAVLRIEAGDSGAYTRFLIGELRKAIKAAGGNVQTVLGTR